MSLHPILKWSQRKDKIFIILNIRDIMNEKVTLKQNRLQFIGESHGSQYQFSIDFYQSINQSLSQWSKTGFSMLFILMKSNINDKYWPRLIKQNKKSNYIQIDWDKWIDQDQQEQQGHKGLNDLDYNNMNHFNDSDDQQDNMNYQQDQIQEKQKGNINDLDQQEDINENKQIAQESNNNQAVTV